MSNAEKTNHDARPRDSERNEVLNAIGSKWDKFSKQDLADLKTNDDLVNQLVDKYGMEKDAARKDVGTLMNGRSLAA
jgi:hypothetical protein